MSTIRLNSIMSVNVTYLSRRSPTGPYWFKRKVPKDLVSAVGKTWIQFSLGTKDPRQAARLVAKHATEQDQEWSSRRSPATGDGVNLDTQARRLLAERGVDPVDPRSTPEALDHFHDFLESQLPREVLEDGNITEGHQLDRYLPPVLRAAFQVSQGRRPFTLTDCRDQSIAARPSTEKDARLVFGYLQEYLKADRDLRKVRRQDVNGFVAWLLDGRGTGRKVSTTTVGRYLTTLRAAFARSIREHELRIDNVFAKVEIPGEGSDAKERETFSADQYQHLYQALDQWSATRGLDPLRCILTLVCETGARLAEIVGLAASDLDFNGPMPYLKIQEHPWRSLKTPGSARVVPLSPRAQEAAEVALDLRGDAAELFPGRAGKSDSVSAALIKWLRTCEGLRGSKLSNHSLRHGMKDQLRGVQCPDSIQDAILGHATPGVGATYGKGYPLEVLAQWLEKASVASAHC